MKLFITLEENSSDNLKELSIRVKSSFFRRVSVLFQTVLTRLTKLTIDISFDSNDFEHPIRSSFEYSACHLNNLKQLTVLRISQMHFASFIRDVSKMEHPLDLKFSMYETYFEDNPEIVKDEDMQELGRRLKQLKSIQINADVDEPNALSYAIPKIIKQVGNLSDIHIHTMDITVELIQMIFDARIESQSDSILTVYTDKLEAIILKVINLFDIREKPF